MLSCFEPLENRVETKSGSVTDQELGQSFAPESVHDVDRALQRLSEPTTVEQGRSGAWLRKGLCDGFEDEGSKVVGRELNQVSAV